MQKSEQVSAYFLYDLNKFHIFAELSERHWQEELVKYNESDLETDEAICWDRYKHRSDLSAHFQEAFPQHQKQSFLLMMVSIFEDYLNQLCRSLHFEKKLCCSLKDYSGSGIDRAKKYLKKVAKVYVPTETASWQKIIDARDIRNIIAHNAGHIDEELHRKQVNIITRSPNLNYHKFARFHLDVKQAYILEVIEAMENVANELWRKTTVNE
jgi:HrpA-like RNA helicase